MDIAALRDRFQREERLDEEVFHLFALEEMVEALRGEREYDANGHTGVILLKSDRLRVVLEVARDGVAIGNHVVPGPTVVQILQGSLHVTSEEQTRIAHPHEMIVIPHDRPRRLYAEGDAAFLWALSLDGRSDADDPEAGS